MSSSVRRPLPLPLLVAVAACAADAPPVEWEPPRTTPGIAVTAPFVLATDGRVTPADTGSTSPVAPDGERDAAFADSVVPRPDAAGRCAVVERRTRDGATWRAWWRLRPDASAVLEAAVRAPGDSVDARTLVVDTLDRAPVGCARPAPAIAVDSVNGYVHLAYWSQAVEGPGLFYAHLMDPRATRFEPPTALVYGDLPARTAIASHGDTVAIAYEDPNSARGRIALHLSLTGGHLFEQTARLVRVNPGQQPASDPRVVVTGGRVVVGWRETSPRGDAVVVRAGRIVTR